MKIEFTDLISNQDIDYLTQKILSETPEYGTAEAFAFYLRDENNEIIAGCDGSIVFGEIYTDQLWVHSSYRNQGLAKKLMMNVHEHGIKKGCALATISTMDFQNAVNFYLKLGYMIDFERSGYMKGTKCIFLSKKL